MKMLRYMSALAMVAIASFVLAPALAFAADGATTVEFPLGEWVAALKEFVTWVIPLLVVWLFRFLPASLASKLKTSAVDQMLAKALSYGFNTVAGAVPGMVKADVGNAVIAQAANYVLKYGPAWMVKWLGGIEGIKSRLIARLNLDKDVSLVGASTLVDVDKLQALQPAPRGL